MPSQQLKLPKDTTFYLQSKQIPAVTRCIRFNLKNHLNTCLQEIRDVLPNKKELLSHEVKTLERLNHLLLDTKKNKIADTFGITGEEVAKLFIELDLHGLSSSYVCRILNFRVPPYAHIKEELKSLIADRDVKIHIDSIDNHVTIKAISKNISFEDLNLGSFWMNLDLDICDNNGVGVEASDPVYDKVEELFFHPHVNSNGTLCEGDATEPLFWARYSLSMSTYFSIIENVLSTYNPDSPYKPLIAWNEKAKCCTDCGTLCEVDDCFISDWGDIYCYDCCYTCVGCGDTKPPGSGSQCEECLDDFCEDCMGAKCLLCQSCYENLEKERLEHEQEEQEEEERREAGR